MQSNNRPFEHVIIRNHAAQMIEVVQLKLSRFSEEEIATALNIRAFNLGKCYPGCSYNPFEEIQHKRKLELAESFFLGTDCADVVDEQIVPAA